MKKKTLPSYFTICIVWFLVKTTGCFGQSPEFSIREFASGQIKKGVRSIGMGGDGATWGNYSLVYRDSNTVLVDAGNSLYSNDNNFSFTALGVVLPPFKNGLTIFALALSQYASNISTTLKSPGFGNSALPVHGDGNNQSIFAKAAMPIGKKISIGILVSYERSQFNGVADLSPLSVRYQTNWLPSGGFGITWQANKRFLLGVRALFNNDNETRIDNLGSTTGLNNTQEYRAGVSAGLWKGALVDVGGNIRHRENQLNNVNATSTQPNLGFEQNLWKRHFAFRFGLDETSKTFGMSFRFSPIAFDLAFVDNLAIERLGSLFGTSSNSLIATFVFDYASLRKK